MVPEAKVRCLTYGAPRCPRGHSLCSLPSQSPVGEHPVFTGSFLVEPLLSCSRKCFLPTFPAVDTSEEPRRAGLLPPGRALPGARGPGFRPVPCEAVKRCGSGPVAAVSGMGGRGLGLAARGPRGQLSLRGATDSSLLNRGWQVPRRRPLSPFVLVQSFLGPRAAGPSTWTPRLRADARHVSRAGEGPGSLELGRRICSPTPSTGPASRIGGRGPPRSSGGRGTGGAVTKARSRCSVTATPPLSLYPPPRVPAALPAHRPPRGALGLPLLTPHREGKLLWTGFRPHRSLCLSLTSRLSLPHLPDLSAVVRVDGARHSAGWGLLLSLLTRCSRWSQCNRESSSRWRCPCVFSSSFFGTRAPGRFVLAPPDV